MTQIDTAAQVFGEAFASLVAWVLSWWMTGQDPGLAMIRRLTVDMWPVVRWVAAAGLAFGLVFGGLLVMTRRRGADLAELMLGLGRFLVVLAGGWLLVASAWRASESLANWILADGIDAAAYRTDLQDALSSVEPVLALTLSVVGIGACLAMVSAILLRWVAAVLLALGLPVLAAFSVARASPGLRQAGGWLVAVLAFRPLAYLLCRVGHELHTSLGDPLVVLVVTIMTFLVIAVLLPLTAQAATGRLR